MSERIFVGLSGGVDSAVSAALLKQRGYEVTGAFIKIWRPEFTECTWKEDRVDAMRVCAALDIPYKEVDLSDEYKRDVVDAMLRDYAAGITPNPDVLCNRSIKFGHFSQWAFSEGAELVATGHYARIQKDGDTFRLLRGIDASKDQSYFLHRLDQRDLSRTLFPIGDMKKAEVRALAKKLALPVAHKHDSQGLCFVGDVSMGDFLSTYIRLERGPVVDMNGNVIGEHDGAALYTIGQRQGLSIQTDAPHFVVATDIATNTVKVSKNKMDTLAHEVCVKDMHWISRSRKDVLGVQTRYRDTPCPAHIRVDGNTCRVQFSEPHTAAHGQSLVPYDGDECLGGGAICKCE